MEIMNKFSIPGGKEGQRVDATGESGLNRFKPWQIVLLILLMAFTLRLLLVLQPEVIHNDGTEYVRHAKQILTGNWEEGKSGPVYPAFIALAYSFIKNYELAGIWVSVIFGTLLVLPVFYLGRTIFNEKVGIISALVAAVHPFLYKYSGSVLTESIYSFFIATSVLFGWYAFSRGKFHQILLFSLFASLTYLTRPEGVGILFVFCVWALLVNPPNRKRAWRKRAGIIFLSIFCFLLFSSPYLIQLRKELGSWQISKKTVFSAGSPSEEDSDLKEIGKRDKINVGTFFKEPLVILGKIGIGFLESFYKFQQAFNPILFLLAIVGWIKIIRVKSSHLFRANLYVLSNHVFFFAFVLPIFWVLRRYTSHMNAISIPWAAFGFLEVLVWVKRWIEWESLRKKVSLILLLFLLSGLFIQARVSHKREGRFIQREAGLWMKDHLPRSGKIMVRMPQEAFYAELPWLMTPKGSYEKILEKARSDGAKYLVVDEDIEKRSPGFWGKLDEKDLILINDIREKKRRMVIFEIVYAK
jgi:4-amino-4-deoxy-L-arabinose transferase-like glycosyltransferase